MAEVLHGNVNDNQLNARADKSQVYGLKGNDTLISDNKNDVLLVGGSGDDSLIMLGGTGTLSGGEGSDTFELNYSADKKLSAVIEDLEPSSDKIVVKFDGETTPQISVHSISGGDVVWKDGDGLFKVTLKSVRENDYFDGTASEEAWKVLELTNAAREAANESLGANESLSALTMSDGLTAGAEIRVQEITQLGEENRLEEFEHTRPNGEPYETVFEEVGKEYSDYAENIQAGATSPEEVIDKWMNSPAHRKNILDEESQNYSKLGVGYNYDDTDPSDQRYYWEQLFGSSLKSAATLSTAEILTANVEVDTVSKFIQLTEGNNTVENSDYGATISGTAQADSINNTGLNVSISGGADNDSINNSGSFVTIIGGTGDDQINLSNDAQENLIEYATGDGNDSISGLNSTDTLSISGSEFTPVTVGNNIIVAVGADSITLSGAVSSGVQIAGTRSKLLVGTEDADNLNNTDDAATILAKGGDDYIENTGSNVLIDGAAGNDYIKNSGAEVSIDGASGNDSIDNRNSNVTIIGGAGDDEFWNEGNNVSIDSGAGNDSIWNEGSNVTILSGAGNDTIDGFNETSTLKISGESFSSLTIDDDLILINSGTTDSIRILNGADLSSVNILDAEDNPVQVNNAKNIVGTEQADSLSNDFDGATIQALGGNDTIQNNGENVSITGGAGDDQISNNQRRGTVYIYESGNDSIDGFNYSDALDIGNYAWETVGSGNDIIVNIINNNETVGTVTLKDYPANQEIDIISSYVPPSEPGEEIDNSTDSTLITGTANDDTISNTAYNVTIEGLAGHDSIRNEGSNSSVFAGAGNDYIFNDRDYVSIDAGTGSDTIECGSTGHNVTIVGGSGNDSVHHLSYMVGTVYVYTSGNDTIESFNEFCTLVITDDYTMSRNGDTIVINVEGKGTITLIDYNYLAPVMNIVSSLDDVKRYNITRSYSSNTVIAGTNNEDYIYSNGTNVSINMAAGDDYGESWNDSSTILGGDGNDKLYNGDYTDIAGNLVLLDGGNGDDTMTNGDSSGSFPISTPNVTMYGGAGNDKIRNYGNSVTIDGGTGDDSIRNGVNPYYVTSTNMGYNVTISGGDGSDTIESATASNVTIDGGADDDFIYNQGSSSVSINAGTGNDVIYNFQNGTFSPDNVTIDGGAGNDYINNYDASNVSISGGAGNDEINNGGGLNVTIDGGAGDDTIVNYGDSVTIDGGVGNDSIDNGGLNVSISGGAGNDSIHNEASNVSIFGGTGDDQITLWEESKNNFIRYALGDGNDTIWGINTSDTLNFLADASLVSSIRSGEDIIFHVGNGEILLVGARNKPPHITYGESGSSGGTSSGNGNGGNSGGSSSGNGGNNGGSNSGSGGSNSTGGTSSSEGRGSDASGSQSSGSGSAVAGTSTGINSGSSGSSSSSRGGNDSSRNAVSGTTSYISSNPNSSAPITTTTAQSSYVQNVAALTNSANTSAATEQQTFSAYDGSTEMVLATAQPSSNQHFYAGNNQLISDYQSGERIIFGEAYIGSTFDDKGTFLASSSTGILAVQNATDKFIDLVDVNGNTAIEVYAATIPTIIDGRGRAGFKIFNGSDGPDEIYAGDDNSQLWGGNGFVSDTLTGGEGNDIFIGGKNQGSDMFRNVSASDEVRLTDVTLNDISDISKEGDTITISLNNGNVLSVQSSEETSGAIVFGDSTWHFKHTT